MLGTRARGHAAAGKFNHADGSGYVAPHAGDYRDAINNRKATVHLLVHEATMGSMSPYAARRLRHGLHAQLHRGYILRAPLRAAHLDGLRDGRRRGQY